MLLLCKCVRERIAFFYFLFWRVSLERAWDSHRSDTAWSRSAERRWTSSGSCASQSGTLRKRSGPSGSSRSQRWWFGGLFHSWRHQIKKIKLKKNLVMKKSWNRQGHPILSSSPKEKVIAEVIVGVSRGCGVTVVHENVPPVGGQRSWNLVQIET